MSNVATLSQWQAFSSGLVQVHLAQDDGALVMQYDFGGAGGFVVARRLLSLQLPERFRFRLRLRGEGLPNRLEFKLVDPSGDNVWWYRRAAVVWAGEWEEWLLESRDFEFAWGPAGGGQPSAVAAVELAIVAEAGGAGRLWLADLQVEDLSAREACIVTTSGTQTGFATDITQGTWRSDRMPAWFQLDLLEPRAFSALRIEWEPLAIGLAFEISISNDGVQWQTVLTIDQAGGRCSDIYLGPQMARFVRLQLQRSTQVDHVGIIAFDVISVERARSLVEFLHDVAQRQACGAFPKYFRRQQSYWTVFGLPGCPTQGLINEEGMVEVQRAGFALEPFINCSGQWLTWADAKHAQSLSEGYLPIPAVLAEYGTVSLQVEATAVQLEGVWCASLSYTLTNTSRQTLAVKMVLAVRPFQVVPPWQAYREFGDVHAIQQMVWQSGRLCVDQSYWVLPQMNAQGGVHAWLQPGLLESGVENTQTLVRDPFGLAQGTLTWSAPLAVGESRQFCVAVPFDAISAEEVEGVSQSLATHSSDEVFASALQQWREVLDRQGLRVPDVLSVAAAVSRTSVSHILLNRDGAAIQPGPRRYARSWIRDGATMCAALLRTGNNAAVRDFLQWYAPFVRSDGFVPCCVDREGVDWLVEHDSHGQWMHVVAEYLLFSGDRSLVEALLPSVIKAGQYVIALRASRYTSEYDTPAMLARRGLIPESVSHEGYLAQPVHSYWDSFWAIRGLADAAALCRVVQNDTWAETFTREEKALRADVKASIARVIAEREIPHIPGSVEWADSDPTASACAVGQLGESDCYPAEALRYTFDGFMQHWRTRMADISTRTKYSAYDIRVINALVKLGRREDAWEIARFYLQDRRPCGWNQWPEITWPDPQSPGHLGDLPHSWIGAEYVLAFRCLFVDEYHDSLVIGQGLLAEWLQSPGIAIKAWPTAWGALDYDVAVNDKNANDEPTITLTLSGDVMPPGGIDIQLPFNADIERLDIDTPDNLLSQFARRVCVRRSPTRLVFTLQKKASCFKATYQKESGPMTAPSSLSLNALPAIRILGNGRYTVMVHGQGGGFSRFDGWALNDWNGDRLQEQGGWIFYVRDLDNGAITAFGVQPQLCAAAALMGDAHCAQLTQRIDDLTLTMQVHVAAAHPCEVRQITLTNHSDCVKRLQVTAFLPIALNHPAAHGAHPAFSKLFVQTEWLPESQALLARRRPRAAGERAPCMAARLIGPGELRWDTDRARFLGRGWGLQSPQGIVEGLAAHQTNVLDPAFVLQRSIVINATASQSLTLVMGAAESRDEVAALMYLPLSALSSTASNAVDLTGVDSDANGSLQALSLQALAGAMFYGWPTIAAPAVERQSASGHPGIVWGYGMPTDKPFVLVTSRKADVIAWALQAKRYWQALALDIPMLVLADDITDMNAPGVVARNRSDVSDADLTGLRAVAACIIDDTVTSVSSGAAESAVARIPLRHPTQQKSQTSAKEDLLFDNGYGGFSADGREYVVRTPSTGQRLVLPPVPWVNVLANPDFGCLVSETGTGSTWSVNSRERRITPWSNDPVLDPHDEAFYLRDNVNCECWSPLPGPALSGADYEARHGFGYTRFVHVSHQLEQLTTVFVHRTLPVKITRLQLRNLTAQPRRITVVAYQRLVLGFVPTQSSAFVATKIHTEARTLTAANRMGGEFAQQFAIASCVSNTDTKWQAGTDRAAFLGTRRDISNPAGLYSDEAFVSAAVSSDPCFVQKIELEIPPQGELAVSFLLGDVASEAQMQQCLQALNTDAKVQTALADIKRFWQDTLTAVQVETPSTALNFMLNGWLLYQTLVCRVWGRTAFYQSSGAFGFRDQLQDSGALIYARPDLTRQQILLHASRQFVEGDVQHWWHEPPVDRGLRTRFSDDLNWLPLLTAFYIKTTGDVALLDEQAPFLTAPLLEPGEDEVYLQAQRSGQSADIYEHCCRALDISLTKGVHGLPLMGTGDWNDGMNRVGREGKGESVWMGFFLYHILGEFLPFCEKRLDAARMQRYQEYRDQLAVALNNEGWDGEWYRRAWYDNGNPVGSKDSDECQIDALAQAWAVISGVAPAQRADQALQSLEQRLVDPVGKLIRLLAPSFINTPNDPGYIKGYVAGVRENGGQYTHAASWVVRAMAERGKTERALALLEMILPIAHTSTREDTDCYKTEPYVAVADIYGEAPHVGRGGWTWYTGSSGWLYRVGLESVLGITLRDGNTLMFQPCVPKAWDAYSIRYRLPQGGVVDIKLQRHPGNPSILLNGQQQPVHATGPLLVKLKHPDQNQTVEVYWSDE